MHTIARLSVFLFLVAFCTAVPVLAFNPVEEATLWEIPRLGAPSQVVWESHSVAVPGVRVFGAAATPAPLAAFAENYGGDWRYQVNRVTGTFHHVYGSGIDLSRAADSEEAAETLAREFVRESGGLFGVGNADLRIMSNARAAGKRSVIFQQTCDGLRVWGGRAHVVFTEAGRLFAFGSDAYPGIGISTTPGLSESQALEIAQSDIGFQQGIDEVDYRELMVLPVESGEEAIEYRLAYRFDLRTEDPFGIWATWVDANSGEILWRENPIRFADYAGHVQGDVEWDSYCDG
jgi:hypothetical protein